MVVRLEKDVPAQRVPAPAPPRVSLVKAPAPVRQLQLPPPHVEDVLAVAPRFDPPFPPPHVEDVLAVAPRFDPPFPPSPARARRFGGGVVFAAFTAGLVLTAVVVGGIASSSAEEHAQELAALQEELTDARDENGELEGDLEDVRSDLARVRGDLREAQSRADDVDERAREATETEAALDQRQDELDARAQTLDAQQADLEEREAAIRSNDVGHPLADSISDDGTWVVGRDIQAGTWTSSAYDTGCTWSVSDGRSGAGDGGYGQMEVELVAGQKFTVRGCTLWSTYDY